MEQYSQLWEYCIELKRMNPSSSMIMKCSMEDGADNPKFQRLYICLAAMKRIGKKVAYQPLAWMVVSSKVSTNSSF